MKKNKIKYIFICVILISIVTMVYFATRNHVLDNNIEKEILSKDHFYNFSEDVLYELEVNKNYVNEKGNILTFSKENLAKQKYNSLSLNKYYFVDINGNIQEEYMRAYIKLYTYKDNTIMEEFKLGIGSLYNVIYLQEDYDSIRFQIVYSGIRKFHN